MNLSQVILDGFISALVGVCTALVIIVLFTISLVNVIRNKLKGTMVESVVTNFFQEDKKP